jgi:hypothetical protein
VVLGQGASLPCSIPDRSIKNFSSYNVILSPLSEHNHVRNTKPAFQREIRVKLECQEWMDHEYLKIIEGKRVRKVDLGFDVQTELMDCQELKVIKV